MKRYLSLTLVFLLMFTSNVFASNLEKEGEKGLEEENIIIDMSTTKILPVNLIADYDADYKDLLKQIQEQDGEYQLVLEQLKSDSINLSEEKELLGQLGRLEVKFDDLAKDLLAIRYTDDKKQIRPDIISNYQNADQGYTIQSTSTPDRTFNKGNYGDTDEYAEPTNAWYTHKENINWLKQYNESGSWFTSTTVSSGVSFTGLKIADSEIQFRSVDMAFASACGFGDSYVSLEVSAFLYDSAGNQLKGGAFRDYLCDKKVGYTIKQEGPIKVTLQSYELQTNRTYTAFLRTYAQTFRGKIDAGDGYGTKWERIEIYYR